MVNGLRAIIDFPLRKKDEENKYTFFSLSSARCRFLRSATASQFFFFVQSSSCSCVCVCLFISWSHTSHLGGGRRNGKGEMPERRRNRLMVQRLLPSSGQTGECCQPSTARPARAGPARAGRGTRARARGERSQQGQRSIRIPRPMDNLRYFPPPSANVTYALNASLLPLLLCCLFLECGCSCAKREREREKEREMHFSFSSQQFASLLTSTGGGRSN